MIEIDVSKITKLELSQGLSAWVIGEDTLHITLDHNITRLTPYEIDKLKHLVNRTDEIIELINLEHQVDLNLDHPAIKNALTTLLMVIKLSKDNKDTTNE